MNEKIIALRASVDALIMHGPDEQTIKIYKVITGQYLLTKNKILRQLTVEGICKMLFSTKVTADT